MGRGVYLMIDETPPLEPTYHDRLYIQFGQQMSYEHHKKFMELTRERKDYLFDLWLKKNGYV
jgi:hypothetical protein